MSENSIIDGNSKDGKWMIIYILFLVNLDLNLLFFRYYSKKSQ